jgi:uncharacterized OB-fold protein
MRKVSEGLFHLPEGDEPGYLIGSRCGSCGTVSFPRRRVCPGCLEREAIDEIPLSRKGILYTYSVNRQAPLGFTAPYVTGKVDLPEKVRIFSLITGVEPDDSALRIGQPMELVFGAVTRDASGAELWGYMFQPVQEGE